MEPETVTGGSSGGSNLGKWLFGIIVIIVIVLIVAWVGKQPATAPATNTPAATETSPIKIGFIGPLTGDASSIGTVNRAGVELAVAEVNQGGGINGRQLQMIYEDGKCNSTAAINAAQKLINVDKVPVIIGGLCSSETSAFGKMAMDNKVIVFSYGSSAPDLSHLGKYFFRSYPSDSFQGKFAAEYAYNTLKARKVAVMYHISDWGTGIKNVFVRRFKELGGTILTEEGLSQDARDYRTPLSKIKTLKPDMIYFPGYPDGSTVALKQAEDLGIKTKFLGGDGWGDPKLWKEVSGRGDFLFLESMSPANSEFQAKVLAKTGGKDVPIGTPNAYDNVKLIAEVIAKVGLDTDKIQAELRNADYAGVSGHITFDQNGDIGEANYIVKKIANGTATVLK